VSVKVRTSLSALPAAGAMLALVVDPEKNVQLALVLIVVTLMLILTLWRCPGCKRYLGKKFETGALCPHCGKKLE